MTNGSIITGETKKNVHGTKKLGALILSLAVLLCCSMANGETMFTKLEYDDIPSSIRNVANAKMNELMHEIARTNRTYQSSSFAPGYAENFDATETVYTTQSQIYVEELHSNIWNIAYFENGTPFFLGAILLDKDGQFLLSYAGWQEEFLEILENKVDRPFYDWTLEEQYVFYELFLHNSYRETEMVQYSLPKVTDLPLDTLIDIGKRFLSEHYHVSQDDIDNYKIQDVYFTGLGYPDDLGEEEGKRILRFVSPSSPFPYEYQVTLSAVNGTVYFSTPFPNEIIN